MCQQEQGEYFWDCILRMLNKRTWKMNLDKGEFIDLGALIQKRRMNALVRIPENMTIILP